MAKMLIYGKYLAARFALWIDHYKVAVAVNLDSRFLYFFHWLQENRFSFYLLPLPAFAFFDVFKMIANHMAHAFIL